MKRLVLLLIVLIPFLTTNSQIEYTCGFDLAYERDAWTEYRMGDTDNHHWDFPQANCISYPRSLAHDYPMDMGVDSVDDWIVSPPLWMWDFALLFINVMQSRMSIPPDVYFGVWYSIGSPDPADNDYIELMDLTLFPDSQFVYGDTIYEMPIGADTAYVAFRYKATYYSWLMVWLDDLNILGAYQLSVDDNYAFDPFQIKIFPNPASDYLDIQIAHYNKESFKFEVIDVCGNKVLEYNDIMENQLHIDISVLKKGLYFCRLSSEDQLLYSGKLIKQ